MRGTISTIGAIWAILATLTPVGIAAQQEDLDEGLRRPNPHRVGPRSVTHRDTLGTLITSGDDYPRIWLGLDAVSAWQALDQDSDSGELPDLEPGFQAALGNLHLTASLAPGIDVYAEFYLSVRQHLGQFRDREGWVRISSLPEAWDLLSLNPILEHIDVKAGHFEVDFGNQHLFRSDNAQVQKNPLVGNFLVDPNTVEAGVEVIGNEGIFNWLVGIGAGTTQEDFSEGSGTSLHGKVWLEPEDAVWNVAASVYTVDHSDNPSRTDRGTWGELFSGNRSGSRYAEVVLLPVNNQLSGEAGQVNFGNGQDELAWQLDGHVNFEPLWIYGHYGRFEDADLNGSAVGTPEEEWEYMGVEATWDLIPDRVYAATRYGRAWTEIFQDQAMDAFIDRFQIGAGYWLFDRMLVKAEYVTQRWEDFTVGWDSDPSFEGFVLEGSVSY